MAWCVQRRRARAQRMCSPAACTVPRAIRSVLSVRGSCALSRARFGSGAELTTHSLCDVCTPRRLGEDPPPFAAGGFDALGSGSHRTTGTAALSYTVYFRSVGRRKEGNDLLHTHTTTHTRTHNHTRTRTRTHTQTTSDPLEEENQRKWICCCMLHRCGPSRRARLLSAALSTLCPHSPLASRGSLRVIARTGTVGTVVPCGVLRPRRSSPTSMSYLLRRSMLLLSFGLLPLREGRTERDFARVSDIRSLTCAALSARGPSMAVLEISAGVRGRRPVAASCRLTCAH
jgi:hypothetical protein